MALRFKHKEWTEKPPLGTPLRTDGHWSAQGLVLAHTCSGLKEQGKPSGEMFTPTSSPTLKPFGILFDANAEYVSAGIGNTSGGAAITTDKPITVLVIGTCNASNTTRKRLFRFSEATYGSLVTIDFADGTSNGIVFGVRYGTSTFASVVSTGLAPAANKRYIVVGRHQPGGYPQLIVDGVNKYTSGTAATLHMAPTTCTMGGNAGTFTFNGTAELVLVWNKYLTDTEIAAITANPYQMFQPRLVPVVFEAGGTTYTESLYDTAVTVATITDLVARVESLLTNLSAFGSATDTVTASESVSTTAQAAGTVQAAATAVESVLSTLIGTGSVTDSVSGVAAETVTAVASSSAAVSDVLNLVESALVMVQSADSVVGVLVAVEELLTSMQAVASSQDDVFSGLVENVLTTAVGSASAEAVQAMQETVLVMAQAGTSLATVAAFIEQVSSTATATGSVVDAIVGSFLGSYLCGTEVRQRPYGTEVRQRPYVTEVRQRPNTMEVRQRCR